MSQSSRFPKKGEETAHTTSGKGFAIAGTTHELFYITAQFQQATSAQTQACMLRGGERKKRDLSKIKPFIRTNLFVHWVCLNVL